MSVILFVYFDDGGFEEFKILNPPATPLLGDHISFKWSNFITDTNQLVKLEEFEQNDYFIVGRLWKKIFHDKVEVSIVLEKGI